MTICSLDIDWFAILQLLICMWGVHNQRWLWLDKELLMCHSVSTAVHALHLCVHFLGHRNSSGHVAGILVWTATVISYCCTVLMGPDASDPLLCAHHDGYRNTADERSNSTRG